MLCVFAALCHVGSLLHYTYVLYVLHYLNNHKIRGFNPIPKSFYLSKRDVHWVYVCEFFVEF